MKFSAAALKKSLVTQPFSFSQKVDVSELVASPDNDIREISLVQVDGICSLEKNNLIFSFNLSGEMTLPCARTLVDVPYPFQFQGTEIFTFSTNVDEEDEDVHQIVDDTIDLKPYILENIILNMPFRVFSNEKGLEHGEGWQLYTEEQFEDEQSSKIDPRMEKLQQWFDKK